LWGWKALSVNAFPKIVEALKVVKDQNPGSERGHTQKGPVRKREHAAY
jgi:hypothetical protein